VMAAKKTMMTVNSKKNLSRKDRSMGFKSFEGFN